MGYWLPGQRLRSRIEMGQRHGSVCAWTRFQNCNKRLSYKQQPIRLGSVSANSLYSVYFMSAKTVIFT